MPRPLSSYDYSAYLTSPDEIDVPTDFATSPLPELVEPTVMPLTPVPAPRDSEQMVPIEHRAIRVLSPYWHEGWASATPGAYARSGVTERLGHVTRTLPNGFGLAILDAWRPLTLQTEIYEAAYADPTLPAGFVSEPSHNPATPPPHLTGGTVDVTLTWRGRPLALGTGFDDFSDLAHTAAYEHTPGRVRQLRRLLFWSMRSQGFRVLGCEWWHFEIGTRRWSAITGEPVWYSAADLLLADRPHFSRKFRLLSPAAATVSAVPFRTS